MLNLFKVAGRLVFGTHAIISTGDSQPKSLGIIAHQPVGKLLVLRR